MNSKLMNLSQTVLNYYTKVMNLVLIILHVNYMQKNCYEFEAIQWLQVMHT